ncbi:MAG: hypothetical protein CMH50_09355 [Myxococcales bacterium]|nr:hypothetical protein [Myxococcales bacterium]
MSSLSDDAAPQRFVGPFALGAPLGKGGMGRVFVGQHQDGDTEVAIKVLDVDGLGKGDTDGFYREVRAVAGLDHPHIVQIYDFGTLPEGWNHPELKDGAPWLAMEMCRGGSLAERGPRDWGELVIILEQLLSGLSSAHARGVLHRDLKPDNLLLSRPADESWDLRIVDFGLAFETQSGAGDEGIRGTPRYMAPEQFQGRWRHFGPWTDLYALGCLAWRLVTGESPFGQMTTIRSLAQAHLRLTPPPLAPGFQVPSALEAWLNKLLAKDPRARFRNAALAADELQAISLDSMLPPDPLAIQRLGLEGYHITDDSLSRKTLSVLQPAVETQAPTLPDQPTQQVTVAVTLQDEQVSVPDQALVDGVRWEPQTIAVPRTWRVGQWMSDRQSLSGAGLALIGLRQPPFVDRAIVRDRLWNVLREATQDNRPRFVVLEGEQGQGKSRLAQWLGERAVELGVAQCLRISHCHQLTAASGVEGAIERACMAQDLPPRPLQEQLGWRLGGDALNGRDLKGLARLLVGEEGLDTTGSQDLAALSPGERERLLTRVLQSFTAHGPLILWVDDVQWGLDSLHLVHHLAQQSDALDCPLVVLMTLVPSLVSETSNCHSMLESIGADRLRIGPLNRADTAQLIREHLPVSDELSILLAQHARGRPSVAVQLVEQLAAEHRLKPSSEGFVLEDGDQLDLPDGMVDLWQRRLQQVLGETLDQALPFLELAALLGQEADLHELMQAGIQAGLAWEEDILDQVDRAGLVNFRAQGLVMRFTDNQLHRLLLERCRTSGRWQSHHRAIATMLTARYGDDHGVEAARLAGHHREAQDFEAAAKAYLVAARHRMRLGEYERALGLGRAVEECIELEPGNDLLRVEAQILMGMLACHRGSFEELEFRARAATDTEDPVLAVLGHILAARWHHVNGEPTIAAEMLEVADRFANTREHKLLVHIERLRLARRVGRLDDSQSLLATLDDLTAGEHDERVLGKSFMASGHVLVTLQQWDLSLAAFLKAQKYFQTASMVLGEADACNGAGRVLAKLGRVDEAVEMLSEASQIYSSLNHPAEVFPMLTQGVIELESGRYLAARKTMQLALERVIASGRLDLIGPTHAVLVPCAAAAGDWEAFDGHLMQARSRLASGNVLDKDIAEPLTLAGKLARAQSQDDRARAVYDVARQQWLGLGESDQVEAIDEEVFLLGDG